MKSKEFLKGTVFLSLFVLWTVLITTVDVRPVGANGTSVGLATINGWFHSLTGVNMLLYHITDWVGLAPIFVCFFFAFFGLSMWVKRRSLLLVDIDILLLGVYYVIVISGYLIFEMIPINYRPILICGYLEASYPSSTTLLVLSVMPTLEFQADLRAQNRKLKKIISFTTALFSIFMVVSRAASGVHWLTDIIGSVFLSLGLFYIYKGVVKYGIRRKASANEKG